MFIEINLVHSTNIYSNVFSLITRSRTEVEDNDNAVMGAIIEFIKNNISTFDAALADKDLVSKLNNIDALGISEFYSLKYIIASAGLDILVNEVAEMEVNADAIDENTLEYSVVDNLGSNGTFLKLASKVVLPDDTSNLSEVYGRVIDGFNFFSGELFNGYSNPLMRDLELVKSTEKAIGVSPASITSDINSILQYLGKELFVITN